MLYIFDSLLSCWNIWGENSWKYWAVRQLWLVLIYNMSLVGVTQFLFLTFNGQYEHESLFLVVDFTLEMFKNIFNYFELILGYLEVMESSSTDSQALFFKNQANYQSVTTFICNFESSFRWDVLRFCCYGFFC